MSIRALSRRVAGQRRRGGQRAAAALVAAVVAVMVTATAAEAAPGVGSGGFGVTPAQSAGSPARPYFAMTLAPGRSGTDTVIITNESDRTAKLKISRSNGVTAPDSGSAFAGFFHKCAHTACWLTGLAKTVTLGPKAQQALSFTVTVPRKARPRQYLAGITAEPFTKPRPVQVGANGNSQAKAIIIHQVSVGVAVTVGTLARLKARLEIPAVTGGHIGPLPRLYVHVHNTGQRFTHAQGTVTCTVDGGRRTFRVYSNTVLPGDRAVVPVNAQGVGLGQKMPCTVKLGYANGPTATWSGTIAIPSNPRTTIVHTGKGAYSSVPADDIPNWALALIALGGLILLTTTTLSALLIRRHAGVSN